MKHRILFVCLGNICRSPTAEAVFRDRVERAGCAEDFDIDSAGIIAAHAGSPADARMRRHASRRGYDLAGISRQVRMDDFERYDLLIGMDAKNHADLLALAPEGCEAKISLLLAHDPHAPVREVPDPYYGGEEGFEEVLDLVESACDHLLSRLRSS